MFRIVQFSISATIGGEEPSFLGVLEWLKIWILDTVLFFNHVSINRGQNFPFLVIFSICGFFKAAKWSEWLESWTFKKF